VQYLCRKWVENGHKVIVIHNNSCFPAVLYWIPSKVRKKLSSKLGHSFPAAESRKPLTGDDCGVSVYRFPMVKVIPYSKFSNRVLDAQVNKIQKVLERESFTPDVIISHWVNPQVDLVRRLKEKYNARTSLVFHNDCSDKNIDKFALQDVTKIFDAIGCRSDAYAAYVQERLNLPKKPFICYSGIPDEQAALQESVLSTDGLLQRNREFLYVGRLVAYKKVDVIIKALTKTYDDKDFVLHIVGSGAEKERLQGLADDLGVSQNVVFHGQIPRDEVFELMKKCFCFTMVSERETFGMVYIEAMLAGCVTIAAKDGGVDGVIVNEENGYLSPEGDVDALVEVYKKLEQTSDEDVDRLRKNAVRTALDFRDSAVAQRYLDDVLNW
jgi:glycosyltransferase involved in cell wall biosynthesis